MRRSRARKGARFVELREYLCEARAGQYLRLDNLKLFDEFLEKRFPESRRKAYYLMAIHEHLPRIQKLELSLMGWTKAWELLEVMRDIGYKLLVEQGPTKPANCRCEEPK